MNKYSKRVKSSILVIATLLVSTCATALFALLFLKYISPVEPVKPIFTYELGSSLIYDTDYYVEGHALAKSASTVDLSLVDPSLVGTYEAYIHRPFQTIPFQVEILDTTPPELTLKEENLYLKVGDAYPADFFVEQACDLSENVTLSLSFSPDDNYAETVSTAYVGDYYIYVRATDPSGNETTLSRPIYSDTAPEISVSKDYYSAIGYEVDYLLNATAYDSHDGDLTEEIQVDLSLVLQDTPGQYDVIYTATDSFGLTTEFKYPVNLYTRDDLQALINTGQINRLNQTIVGAYNLYDGGTPKNSDTELVMDHFLPCFVRIRYPKKSYGSGFIIEITESDIIICTNQHVVNSDKDFYVYFHDGFSAKGEIIEKVDGVDIAFVKVPIFGIDSTTLNTLKTVHINKGYVDNITTPTDIEICFRTVNDSGDIWRDRTGTLLALETPVDPDAIETYPQYYANVANVCAFSPDAYGGSSGSALLDSHGNLIAMVSFTRSAKDALGHKNFGITLEQILESYEYCFQKQIHYQ